MSQVSAGDLAHDLAVQCEALFRQLIPDCRKVGNELRGHAPGGGAVSMVLHGRKRGRWANWQTQGESGDCLDLVAHIQCGGDLARAYKWALDWLGHERAPPRGVDPSPAQASAPARAKRPTPGTTPLARVREIWAEAADGWRYPIADYLGHRLGRHMAEDAISPALRYHPQCRHARDTGFFPAMVAAMYSLEHAQHVATHVTYLAPQNPGGGWRKAPVAPARKIFGQFMGSIIPLGGSPLREMTEGQRILIGEGIENVYAACSVMDEGELPDRIWAAASLGNLSLLTLPAPADLILVRDNDGGNEAATAMFERGVARFVEQGCSVEILAAPAGYQDMADYVSRARDDR